MFSSAKNTMSNRLTHWGHSKDFQSSSTAVLKWYLYAQLTKQFYRPGITVDLAITATYLEKLVELSISFKCQTYWILNKLRVKLIKYEQLMRKLNLEWLLYSSFFIISVYLLFYFFIFFCLICVGGASFKFLLWKSLFNFA